MGQTELTPVESTIASPSKSSSSTSTTKGIGTPAIEFAVSAAIDQKGLDVKAIDVSKLCSFADNFLLVSGTSERHVKGIADGINKRLRKHCHKPLSITGYDKGEWIVLDFNDLIVHVFYEPSRQFYELDDLWQKAPLVSLSEKLREEMRFLRTGSFG